MSRIIAGVVRSQKVGNWFQLVGDVHALSKSELDKYKQSDDGNYYVDRETTIRLYGHPLAELSFTHIHDTFDGEDRIDEIRSTCRYHDFDITVDIQNEHTVEVCGRLLIDGVVKLGNAVFEQDEDIETLWRISSAYYFMEDPLYRFHALAKMQLASIFATWMPSSPDRFALLEQRDLNNDLHMDVVELNRLEKYVAVLRRRTTLNRFALLQLQQPEQEIVDDR